ncbi:MAG: cadherin-like beta sandwich domain-containing protein [Mucilaginibacter sp.]
MKKLLRTLRSLLVLFVCTYSLSCFAQTEQRIKFATIIPSVNTGQDYTPWLNDNLDSLVQDAWQNNFIWVDLKLPLTQHSIITRLSFYDYTGVFTDAPDSIYAVNGTHKTFLGTFTGPGYMIFDGFTLQSPTEADTLVIHKYSNNIPQKVDIYGYPDTNYAPPAIPSGNADLLKLAVNGAVISPAFNTNTLAYTASVPYATSSVTLTPTASGGYTTIKVNGTTVVSGSSSAKLPLVVGSNIITTVLTAQDGKTTKTYTLTITRAKPSTINTLNNLVLNSDSITPVFSPGVTTYTATAGYAVQQVCIKPIATDTTATITVNGYATPTGQFSRWFTLPVGSTRFTVVVTSQSGAINTYKLTVTRLQVSTNNNLSALVLSNGTLTPAFNPDTTGYAVSVPDSVTSVTVKPTADTTAKITVNNTSVTTGTVSPYLPLAVGPNPVSIIVTAQNGTAKTYNITVTRAPSDTAMVKIPIDSTRWFVLNDVSNGLGGLTNGITTDMVNTGYGLLINNYDAYYPVLPGEKIDLYQIKFYSYQGGNLGNYPLTVSVIDSTGTRTVVGTYQGGVYQSWLGPYPGQSGFALNTPMKNIKYIVLNCWYVFPSEMQLYGHYKAPAATPAINRKYYPLNQYFGINAFEWNFEDPNNPLVVSPTYLNAVKSFTQFRHYMDWNKLESTQGAYTFNPVHSGGWNYDAIYQACQQNNIFVLADLKTLPDWLIATYPSDQQDAENVPVPYGADFSDPNSYLLQAKVAFQYAARYGSNTAVNSSLLSVDTTIRWTNDPENVVKEGMNLVKYIECDNERDKWWKGRKAYQTPYEYAANLSAFYDGNKNTMGPGAGVKNADPTVQVVMGGLASADPSYVQGMVDWCKQHRGYKADGTVNLCWDVINYHLYNNNSFPQGNATTGVAPEVSIAAKKAEAFIQMAHQYCGDMPVWVTESGYDTNQGSPQHAPPIGSKTAMQVEADWILRTSLLYARAGIARVFYYEEYDDNAANPVQYASSGLINSDMSRRPAADYLVQVNKVFGKYTYQQTLNSSPIVDKYVLDSATAYMLVMPTQSGKTQSYTLSLAGIDSAYVYTPVAGANTMPVNKLKVAKGSLAVNVTETPTFVIPLGITTGNTAAKKLSVQPQQQQTPLPGAGVSLYPNPTSRFTTVTLNNNRTGTVNIRVTDMNSGKEISSFSGTKSGQQFSQTIDLGNASAGICIVQVMLNGKQTVKKVIKTNP